MHSRLAKRLTIILGLLVLAGCGSPQQQEDQKETKQEQKTTEPATTESQDASATKSESASTETAKTEAKDDSISLFDGKTLNGWEKIEFGGEGDIEVVDGAILMYAGDPLTGICIAEDTELPTANYEFSLEGMKLEGVDFFASVTFPVNDSFCTLVVGGWGGTLIGLSNLDGQDASDNDTKLRKKFEKDRWYKVRLRVMPEQITAWIDDEQVIDQSIKGVEVSIRNDVISTTPLGITNFITTSQIRNIKLRKLE